MRYVSSGLRPANDTTSRSGRSAKLTKRHLLPSQRARAHLVTSGVRADRDQASRTQAWAPEPSAGDAAYSLRHGSSNGRTSRRQLRGTGRCVRFVCERTGSRAHLRSGCLSLRCCRRRTHVPTHRQRRTIRVAACCTCAGAVLHRDVPLPEERSAIRLVVSVCPIAPDGPHHEFRRGERLLAERTAACAAGVRDDRQGHEAVQTAVALAASLSRGFATPDLGFPRAFVSPRLPTWVYGTGAIVREWVG